MCDTILATASASANGHMLFGKNSDRQRNEAQQIELRPRASHAPDGAQACTYVAIPPATHTHAVLLSRPFWTWGAEMGANEHGVVIGNEGLQARSPAPTEPALIGMDLVRLGLERAASASEAVSVITGLLETHGQGGDCGHLVPAFYQNGFIIADAHEAFVLETIGRDWLVERCTATRTISNGYSIDVPTRTSAGLDALMRSNGWIRSAEHEEGASMSRRGYGQAIKHPDREHIGNAGARRHRSSALLAGGSGALDVAALMAVLRDHGEDSWRPSRSVRSLCMHAGHHDKPGQTTGSLISDVGKGMAVHWVTATAAPCLSIFKPVLLDAPLPDHGPPPTDRADHCALWWRHEAFHRAALAAGLPEVLSAMGAERDALESQFIDRVAAVSEGGDARDRAAVVAACWVEADAKLEEWTRRLPPPTWPEPAAFHDAWQTMERIAGGLSWPYAAQAAGTAQHDRIAPEKSACV